MRTLKYNLVKRPSKQNAWIYILTTLLLSGCEKIVGIDAPRNELIKATIFEDDETAKSALVALYYQLEETGFASGSLSGVHYYGGFSADELSYIGNISNTTVVEIQTNTISPSNDAVANYWSHAFKVIYHANALLESLTESGGLSKDLRHRIRGESLFVRAFTHFYLVNLFGDIPYIRTTNYKINSQVNRVPTKEIFQLIKSDLLEAKDLLKKDYTESANERIFATRPAAESLLSRLYLYDGDWINAELMSTSLIENDELFNLVNLEDVFKANSKEAIWQLKPRNGRATKEGSNFIPHPSRFQYTKYAELSDEVLSSFESEDARYKEWVGEFIDENGVKFHFPFKYKIGGTNNPPFSEYSMVFRLAEQFLIRAEARAHLDKLSEAISDIDVIRARAKLPLIREINPQITKDELFFIIERERRVELLAESGHRWFDLKRTGRAQEVLSRHKVRWRKEALLFPIPENELLVNHNLFPQNPGY